MATPGPSSSGAATVEQLIKAGVNAFRLKISHGLAESGHTILVVRGFSADPAENIPRLAVVTV